MDPDLAALERAVRAEPGDAEAKVRLAHAYAQAGRASESYLTWLELDRLPPDAVREAAFARQEDTLQGLAGGWGRVAGRRAGDDWAWTDARQLIEERTPVLAADLQGGLSWGAEDALREVAAIRTLVWLGLPCREAPPLELLTGLPALRTLALEGEELDDTSLEPVGRLPTLRELYLRGPHLRHAWPRWFVDGSLEHLDAQLPAFGDEGLAALAQVTSLQRLHLSCGVDVTDEGLQALSRLPRLRSLELVVREHVDGSFLDAFAGHGVTRLQLAGGTLGRLEGLAKLPSLRELEVPVVTGDVLERVAALPLTALTIGVGVGLSDDDLARLGACSTLRTLRLGWSSGIDGSGFAAFPPGLTAFAGGAGIGDDGARALAAIPSLERVDLEHAERLGDEGLAALAALPALKALTITGEVTDAGLTSLYAHGSLKELTIKEGITGPYLTDSALDALVEATPGLQVFRQGFY